MRKVAMMLAVCGLAALGAVVAVRTGRVVPGPAAGSTEAPVAGPPGRTASSAEVRARNLDVSPDGEGLPPGRGGPREGRLVYVSKCAGCHGPGGSGSAVFPPLVGGRGSLASAEPLPTVGSYWPYATTVWDYIRRAMPYEAPGSLTANETYAVTAYILYLNGIIGPHDVLSARTLPDVRMPNRHGFVVDPRPDLP